MSTGRRLRGAAAPVTAGALLLAACLAITGCSCGKKPSQTLTLGKTVTVAGFPVRFAKMEVFGDQAFVDWSAPKVAKKSKTKRRNFEFAVGTNSSLVAADGLRYPARGVGTLDFSKPKVVSGRVAFDASGLDLNKLAKIEIDGARWVENTHTRAVLGQPSLRVGKALFDIDQAAPSGGAYKVVLKQSTGYDGVVGTVMQAYLGIPGRTGVAADRISAQAEQQTITFKTDYTGSGALLVIRAVRIHEPGPFTLILRRAGPADAATKKKPKKKG